VIVGFALIFLPRLPAAFTFAQGLDRGSYRSIMGALDVSIGSLIMLSTATYSNSLVIQWLMGIESVLGFELLTAAVSWLLSMYPVLEHRKSLAHEVMLLHFAEVSGVRRLDDIDDSDLQQILEGFAAQLISRGSRTSTRRYARNATTEAPVRRKTLTSQPNQSGSGPAEAPARR
jgi:hypothetical protein